MKWGPTSANSSPARFVFVRSAEAKEKLRPALSAGNVDKTMAAPVTAIVAYDPKFYDQLPRLFPHADARAWFAGNEALGRGDGVSQQHAAGRLFHHRGARAGARLRADVRVRQGGGGRGVLLPRAAGGRTS